MHVKDRPQTQTGRNEKASRTTPGGPFGLYMPTFFGVFLPKTDCSQSNSELLIEQSTFCKSQPLLTIDAYRPANTCIWILRCSVPQARRAELHGFIKQRDPYRFQNLSQMRRTDWDKLKPDFLLQAGGFRTKILLHKEFHFLGSLMRVEKQSLNYI